MPAAWMQTFRLSAAIVGVALVAGFAAAADPPPVAAKPDFATLDALLAKGDYAGALPVADALVAAVRPKPRADDYLPRSIELIKALMRRGGAELRLGRIDAAEATFTEAHRTFKDSEFRRLVVLATRQAGPRLPPAVVDLELAWLDLLFLRMAVVVERLKNEATRWALEDGGTAAREQELRESVDRCLDQWKGLRKAAVEARQSFGERFNASSGAVPASAFARALAGPFRESLLDGLFALEQSRLPAAVLPSEGGESGKDAGQGAVAGDAGDQRSRLRAEATGHLQKAAAELDGVVASLTPKAGGLRPEMRADLGLLEAELLTARARLCLETGESAAARKDLDRVLELRREAGVIRKLSAPDSHADLAEPLVLVATLGIAESRRLLDDGRADVAKVTAEETQGHTLDRAASLATGDDHPLRGRLDFLRRQLASGLQGIEDSIPRSDAVDAAARRMIRAIETVPVGGRDQPAAIPSAQDSGVSSPDSASRSI